MTHAVFTFASYPGCLNCRLSRARELTYLANVVNDSIQSSDLDRPIRGSRLFIGKAAIILTRSVLYSDKSNDRSAVLKQRAV